MSKRFQIIRATKTLLATVILVGLPLGLSGQETSSPYYRNELLFSFGTNLIPGRWNQIERSPEGQVFAVSWEEKIKKYDKDIEIRSYLPNFFYLKPSGGALFSANQPKLMEAHGFSGGLARVLEENREALYGYLGPDGNWAISPRYVDAKDFIGGLAIVREPAGLWGVIGANGTWVLTPRFAEAGQLNAQGIFEAKVSTSAGKLNWYNARTGELVSATDPRLISQPEKQNSLTLSNSKYKIGNSKHVGVEYRLSGKYVSLIDPSGKEIWPHVFNDFDIVGTKAVVSLGYYGDYHDRDGGPVTDFYGPTQGAYALIDLNTHHFLIPPIASQIRWMGGEKWFVSTHDGQSFIYDEVRGSRQKMPLRSIIKFLGPVAIGYGLANNESIDQPREAINLGIYGRINDNNVRVRSQPNLKGEIVAAFKKGTPLHVLEYKPEIETIGNWTGLWARVKTEDESQSGWVFSYFIDLMYTVMDGP